MVKSNLRETKPICGNFFFLSRPKEAKSASRWGDFNSWNPEVVNKLKNGTRRFIA
jgi:hypothetical protein